MKRAMGPAILLAGLALLCASPPGAVLAAGAAPIQGAPGPVARSVPAPPPANDIQCDEPSAPGVPPHAPISVSVNAATAWQPRGGEVLIAVQGDAADLTGLSFKACFGWTPRRAARNPALGILAKFTNAAAVSVRPDAANTVGLIHLGVTVPRLGSAPTNIVNRLFEFTPSLGLGLVPVAEMRLIGYTNAGVVLDEVRPIGITSVYVAFAVTALTLLVAVSCLRRWTTGVPANRPATPLGRVVASARTVGSLSWMLDLARMPNGRASLSAFQVLLWTLVVMGCAAYVMTLSGTLIDVPAGMLTLLGIAGAAGLLASFSEPTPTQTVATQAGAAQAATQAATAQAAAAQPAIQGDPVQLAAAQAAAQAASMQAAVAQAAAQAALVSAQRANVPRDTRWRDLILDPEDGTPNISRVQMLLFTVTSAAFVVVQVLNYYVIPDIPAGYQILIGISNGLYVGRKFTPA